MHVPGTAPYGGALRGGMAPDDAAAIISAAVFGKHPSPASTGYGTPGKHAKFNTPYSLGDSLVSESGNNITAAGHLLFSPDGTWDIGASLATRPNNVWAKTLFDLNDGTVRGAQVLQSSRMDLGTVTAHDMGFFTGATVRFRLTSSGHLLAHTDNAFDIGASLATRPRSLYLGTSMLLETTSPGRIMTYAASGAQIRWDDNSLYTHLTITNADATLTSYGARILFQNGTGSNGTAFPGSAIDGMPETSPWTGVAASQNARLQFSVAVAGVMTEKMRIGSASIRLTNFLDWTTDNTYDIGTNGNRPRDGLFGRYVISGLTTGSAIKLAVDTGGSSTAPSISFISGGASKGVIGTAAAVNDLVTGSAIGDIVIRLAAAATNIRFTVDNGASTCWGIDNGGHLFANADSARDIGALVAGRPRQLYLGTAGKVFINGTQVIQGRVTGWAAPTAALSRTAVAAADTLATTISHLAALVTDLRTHGLIGT